jgi:ankyrin repeat protein
MGNLTPTDRGGRTPLFYASMDGDAPLVEQLIRGGADVNARDSNQETPLHFAVRGYHPGLAALLIENGAKVDAPDGYGNTPLARAVFESRGRGEMIRLLLSHGADKTLRNAHGVSPESLAESIANYDLTPFLTEGP